MNSLMLDSSLNANGHVSLPVNSTTCYVTQFKPIKFIEQPYQNTKMPVLGYN